MNQDRSEMTERLIDGKEEKSKRTNDGGVVLGMDGGDGEPM